MIMVFHQKTYQESDRIMKKDQIEIVEQISAMT